MLSKSLILIVVLAIGYASSEKFSYDGYSLVKLAPETSSHIKLIQTLEGHPNFDLWGMIKGVGHGVDVLLPPTEKKAFTELFKNANLPFNVTVENIQKHVDEQEKSNKRSIDRSIVGTFASYLEIQSWLDDIVSANPDIASTYIAGKTYENRNLKVLKLKQPSATRSIWVDCGIHAREWISPATCVYMVDKMIKEFRAGKRDEADLLSKYEFHILPLMNPDGYEYSQTSYRFWRKNRNPNRGSSCVGTDLNRNSGYQWMTGGSSSNKCSDIYAGPSANSENEIKAVQKALNAKLGNWDAYLTLHAYGQWIFTPWGYTSMVPADYNDLLRKANIGANAIKATYGSEFVTGSSTNILGGVGSGGSEDWAKGVAGIKYAYCLELRPSQYGADSNYGFAIPASRIPYAGEETYNGIKAMLKSIAAE